MDIEIEEQSDENTANVAITDMEQEESDDDGIRGLPSDSDDQDSDIDDMFTAKMRYRLAKMSQGIEGSDSEDDTSQEGQDVSEDEQDESNFMEESGPLSDIVKVGKQRYRCKWCVGKVILNLDDAKKHVKSKLHQKLFKAARISALNSKQAAERQERLTLRKKKRAAKRAPLNAERRLMQKRKRKEKLETLSEADIEKRKKKFAEKKARRLARKAAGAATSS